MFQTRWLILPLIMLMLALNLGGMSPAFADTDNALDQTKESHLPELSVQPDAESDKNYVLEVPASEEEETVGARSLRDRFGWCDRLNPATFGPPIRTIDTRLLYGRKIQLRYHPSSRCSWGRIRNGSPGDEIWVDRSNDGGRTWEPKLGAAKISGFTFPNRRYTEKYTVMFDNKNRLMRACGKAGNRAEIKCTKWF